MVRRAVWPDHAAAGAWAGTRSSRSSVRFWVADRAPSHRQMAFRAPLAVQSTGDKEMRHTLTALLSAASICAFAGVVPASAQALYGVPYPEGGPVKGNSIVPSGTAYSLPRASRPRGRGSLAAARSSPGTASVPTRRRTTRRLTATGMDTGTADRLGWLAQPSRRP